MENEDLVGLAIKGDKKAFSVLIETRKSILYRTAFIYVKNQEDALDVVGETVYRAFLSIKKLRDPLLFQTWLIRILINCALDQVKRNNKVVPLDEVLITEGKISDCLEKEETLDLFQAVNKLDEKCKTVIVLKYFNDLTLQEVAQVMDIPLGTVKTYLHKALKEMKVELKEELA